MAKVTITIEDRADGKVCIICDPTVETMIAMDISGQSMTAAHGYAIKALNEIRKESKNQSSFITAGIPQLKL